MTKVKRTTFFKALYRKLKIEHHEPNSKPVVNSCTPDDWAVPAPYVAPVVLLLLQTRGVFNDNELNMCDECQKKILSMHVLNYKCMYSFAKIFFFTINRNRLKVIFKLII